MGMRCKERNTTRKKGDGNESTGEKEEMKT